MRVNTTRLASCMLVASDYDRFIVDLHRVKKLFSVVKLLILTKTLPLQLL